MVIKLFIETPNCSIVRQSAFLTLPDHIELFICCILLQVAKESAMQFNPDANITAYHDSVMRYSLTQTIFRPPDKRV